MEARGKISSARFGDAKERAQGSQSGNRAQAWTQDRAVAMESRLDRFGNTNAGGKLSAATRKFGEVASKVPGLSATRDSISVGNGVDLLTEQVKALPTCNDTKIHLVMALRRTERDMTQLRTVKAIVKPTTLITRLALQKSAALGVADQMPIEEKLLRTAFKRAAAIRTARPADASNLHLLARIYLLQEMPDNARQLARLALAASAPHPGDVYVTLAETERLAGDSAAAEQYSHLAVKHGSTLGFAQLAELALDTDLANAVRIERYESYAVLVDAADEERYYGVRLRQDRLNVLKRVAQIHKGKVQALAGGFSKREADLQDAPASSSYGHSDTAPSSPPAWHVDPTGRHTHRYWDGLAWTHNVADNGVPSIDPVDAN